MHDTLETSHKRIAHIFNNIANGDHSVTGAEMAKIIANAKTLGLLKTDDLIVALGINTSKKLKSALCQLDSNKKLSLSDLCERLTQVPAVRELLHS